MNLFANVKNNDQNLAQAKPTLKAGLLFGAAFMASVGAHAQQAQFGMVPSPICAPPSESVNDVEREYRIDASRHLYACFPLKVFKGKLPALLFGIVIVEVEVEGATGKLLSTKVLRKPSGTEAEPWVLELIKRASPFPAPKRFGTPTLKFTEIFLVHYTGRFQTDTLTEGQLAE